MGEHNCAEHMHWQLHCASFGDTNIKYLGVRGACKECGKAAMFRGTAGLSASHPTVAIDGIEATFPFLFDGETYDGKAIGYVVTNPGPN